MVAREIFGSIPGEANRIGDFAEILNEELMASNIRVKRKSQFEWKLRRGINTKGKLRIYRSGSNIVYEGKVGHNYIPLALSLILTLALLIISLFFIYLGIFFTFFFLFLFLTLGDVDRLEYEVGDALQRAINRFSPQPTISIPQREEEKGAKFELSPDHYCMYCGRRITPDAIYCPRCGGRIR